MNRKIIFVQFNCFQMSRYPLWRVHPYTTWYLPFICTDDECAGFWHCNCWVPWCHRYGLCCVLWRHRHQVTWLMVPALVRTNDRTFIITVDERKLSCTVWASFLHRRPRHVQAVLDRYKFCIRDDMHFEGICWLFVELSVKNRHTGNDELTCRFKVKFTYLD